MRRSAPAKPPANTAEASADGRPVTPDEIAQVAERLADELEALSAAYERLRQENEELGTRLRTDALTGVASRVAWDEALEREDLHRSRSGLPTSVVIVDVDELKVVNDKLGHKVGDELLQRCGALLARSVRATDLVARIGGDEFGILLRYSDAEQADAWCERLEERMRELGEPMLRLSLGTASVPPSETITEAVHVADRQMYTMKNLARGVRRVNGVTRA